MNKFKVIAQWTDGGRFESAWTTRDSIEEQVAHMVRNLHTESAINITILTTTSVLDAKAGGVSTHKNYFTEGEKS